MKPKKGDRLIWEHKSDGGYEIVRFGAESKLGYEVIAVTKRHEKSRWRGIGLDVQKLTIKKKFFKKYNRKNINLMFDRYENKGH